MKYEVKFTNQFKKDLKQAQKQGILIQRTVRYDGVIRTTVRKDSADANPRF